MLFYSRNISETGKAMKHKLVCAALIKVGVMSIGISIFFFWCFGSFNSLRNIKIQNGWKSFVVFFLSGRGKGKSHNFLTEETCLADQF